ncbi:hypothetical protein CO057_01315 [Candidatus Uhrbacteria bacterium CG_4_9_14_0_2_um_filter_41_50]|uniref:Uncharacterized protein n=1 Tax=Candidatus Uhrbacteria bacterium CG_4_9_14_0_2_um_filter_41_50 TaxID=1975031 RepID=A0A2M8EPR1_9BACT|nr:MAG: hypothetical protein COZ45_03975 [Candidatus Uhrbacteria bacterium CG_4_10_14_3_um_filter_41_21]PIZ55306.1 MAG: hypothetical protein COY24_00915 [Candidatus Uhrbacteria bacterium CG_4_10_14_0_2_um_filter_41_21]PJB84545.1 MAG: hypothetical protein CO086_03085 [Candidatus Uhrbacteria bacterium CG_4_9_14_0_8_um_filter_41_16]PJC24735.1 MAG: hypothetical protein CO057_01315 [Candidatus Uhrbacteria bacterium CG_4_9_14_0_2_um_filter_41_50]PJE74910.1 MAG: hypothetical protein COV03_02975 [Candi
MHTHYRTWFPFILIGLTLALVLGILAWMQSPGGGDVEALQVFAPTVEEYQTEIVALLSDFETSNNAEAAYSQLLNIRVPAEFKAFHFDLALILFHASQDDSLDISADLDTLRSQNNWLQ